MRKFREYIADTMALPKDVVMDLPRVSLCGDKEIFIENHKGILEYSSDVLSIKMNDGILSIYGTNIRILEMQSDRLVINGDFLRDEIEKNGRKVKNVQKNL